MQPFLKQELQLIFSTLQTSQKEMRCPQGHQKGSEVCRRHEKEERMFLPQVPVGNYTFKRLTHLLSKVTGTEHRS